MNNLILKITVYLWKTALIFPWKIQIIFGKLLGNILLIIPFKRNKFSKANIDLCFPELSKSEKNQILKRNIVLSGSVLFNTGISWFWNDEKINKNIEYEIHGLKEIIEDQNNNKSILLFFKHSLHLELDTRILGMNCDIYGVERKHNSKDFNKLQMNGRLKSMKGLTDRSNVFTFIKWLKTGKTVLYAPDQDYGSKRSIKIKFFGHPATTVIAPYKLIQSTKCKMYFLNSYFIENKLNLVIEKVSFNHNNEQDFLQEMNNYIEEKIREYPHEYLWQHRRFKSTLGKNKLYK